MQFLEPKSIHNVIEHRNSLIKCDDMETDLIESIVSINIYIHDKRYLFCFTSLQFIMILSTLITTLCIFLFQIVCLTRTHAEDFTT